MNKIIFVSLVLVALIAGPKMAFAADAIISVSPSTASKNVGVAFDVKVQLDPSGNKTCVATGTLVFDGLTCTGISIEPGLMAQVLPTCSNPNFTLGVPKCTTAFQNLMTISVKGNQAGAATLSISGAKVIGEGVAVAFIQKSGNYTITAIPVEKPKPPVVEEPKPENPVQEPAVNLAEPEPTEPAITGTETQEIVETLVPREAGAASLADTMAKFFSTPVFIIIAIFLVLLFALWLFGKFPFKKKDQQQQ